MTEAQPRKLCLYHSRDLDGQCSGAIYSKANPSGELYPIDYGDRIPWSKIEGADLTIIDWSFQPWSQFVVAMRLASNILWIDHHSSAIEEWKTNEVPSDTCQITTVLDTTKAACLLSWETLLGKTTPPLSVQLLSQYDIWEHDDERVLPFQYGMRLYDLDPLNGEDRLGVWTRLFYDCSGTYTNEIIESGKLQLRKQIRSNAQSVAKSWFGTDFQGKRWQACNRIGSSSSLFDSVRDPDNFQGMITFGWEGGIGKWLVSLYSDNAAVDCGEIAKSFGGGGHKGAAGFHCEDLPFPIQKR